MSITEKKGIKTDILHLIIVIFKDQVEIETILDLENKVEVMSQVFAL